MTLLSWKTLWLRVPNASFGKLLVRNPNLVESLTIITNQWTTDLWYDRTSDSI